MVESDYERLSQWCRDYGALIRDTSADMAEAMKQLADAGIE